jgi:hypothetical protein
LDDLESLQAPLDTAPVGPTRPGAGDGGGNRNSHKIKKQKMKYLPTILFTLMGILTASAQAVTMDNLRREYRENALG